MVTYLYRSRPPGIGCQPENFDPDTRETWLPAREIGGRHFFGRVEYPEPLSMEAITRYELWPEDEVERAELVFYREGKDGPWLRKSYTSQPDELLEEYASRDIKAAAALILKKAERGEEV